MSDIIFINCGPYKNYSVRGRVYFPTLCLYAATILKNEGFANVKIIDYMLDDFSENRFLADLQRNGVAEDSIFFLHFGTKEVPCAVKAADLVKKHFPRAIVGGFGLHPTMYMTQVVDDPAFDFTVRGDLEPVVTSVVATLKAGDGLKGIPNIYMRESHALNFSKKQQEHIDAPIHKRFPGVLSADMNKLPLFDFSLLPMEEYIYRDVAFITGDFSKKRVFRFSTSRGCLYKCDFCTDPFKGYGRMNNETIVRHLDHIVSMYDPEVIFFDDPEFFLSKPETLELVEIIRTRYTFKCITTSRAHYYNENYISKDLIDRLRDRWVIWDMGAETADSSALKEMKKGIQVDHLRTAADYAGELNVRIGFSFMVGIPHETDEQMIETVKFMEELKSRAKGNMQITYQYYQPIGITKMKERAEDLGFLSPKDLRSWEALFDPNTGSTKISLHTWVKRPALVEYLIMVVKYAINEIYESGEENIAAIIKASWEKRKTKNDWANLREVVECREMGADYFGHYEMNGGV